MLRNRGHYWDFVLLNAVWQHVAPTQRAPAIQATRACAKDGAIVVLSVRHGPGAANRPVFHASDDETIALARQAGLIWSIKNSAAHCNRPTKRSASLGRGSSCAPFNCALRRKEGHGQTAR